MLSLKQLEEIPILKKGGIHIKKKNRGKFTEYCGGNVTQECIQRGKNSSNPIIRKRSTFAANARKWKHQKGGVLNTVHKIAGGFVPFYGTYLNWKDYRENPTLANLGWTIASGIGDIASLTGIGYGIVAGTKAIKAANAVKNSAKAIQSARQATRAANQIKMLEYGDVGKNAFKGWVASGKNVINSGKKVSDATNYLNKTIGRFAVDGGIDSADAIRTTTDWIVNTL